MLAHVVGSKSGSIVELDQLQTVFVLFAERIRPAVVLIEYAELHRTTCCICCLPRILECRSDASPPGQSAHAPCPTFTRFTHVLAWLTTKNKREVSTTISVCDGRLIKMTVATALLATVAQPGFGQDLKYKPIAVKTPDGLTISAQEWGNPAGAEILFIHGFSQSYLSWMRQVDSDLAKEFRIVTYDLRGHGNSDKPLDL